MVDGENGHANSHEGHDKVFVERVGFPEDGKVEEHDGKKLARFGKDKCDIIDVSERCVSERGGQRRRYRHQYEGQKD